MMLYLNTFNRVEVFLGIRVNEKLPDYLEGLPVSDGSFWMPVWVFAAYVEPNRMIVMINKNDNYHPVIRYIINEIHRKSVKLELEVFQVSLSIPFSRLKHRRYAFMQFEGTYVNTSCHNSIPELRLEFVKV
jgi:hypothetical protein